MKNVKLKKLSIIEDGAFSKCVKLQNIAIPKNVKWIGNKAFCGCKNLRYILIKSNQLNKKRIGKDSVAKGYPKVRVKTSQKKMEISHWTFLVWCDIL